MIQPEPEPEELEPEAEISPKAQDPFMQEILQKELSESVIVVFGNACALLRITCGEDNFYISFDLPTNSGLRDERLFDTRDLSEVIIQEKTRFYDNLFLKCGDLEVASIKATHQGDTFYEVDFLSGYEPKFNREFLANIFRVNRDFSS